MALVVGDATGYAAAVLSRLDGDDFLAAAYRSSASAPVEELLGEEGCDNVVLEQSGRADRRPPLPGPVRPDRAGGLGGGRAGGAVEQLGQAGRLAAVVEHGRSGRSTIVRKVNDAIGRVTPFDAQILEAAGVPTEPAFQF